MLWICRDCGNEVAAIDSVLVATVGWTALDGDTGRCPICSEPRRSQTLYPRAAESAARRVRTESAIEISRAMVARARSRRLDDPVVEAAARHLGFTKAPCFACQGRGDTHCPNCEGVGDIWRNK